MIDNQSKTFSTQQKNKDIEREAFPKEETISDLSEFFKVLGDPTRIKIFFALLKGELCVHDISNLLGMSQSSISHQLRILRNNKLVKSKRQGKMVIYSFDDYHVESIFQQGLQHVLE